MSNWLFLHKTVSRKNEIHDLPIDLISASGLLTHTNTKTHSHLASRKRERRIMTASQVLCLSCIWMELNLRWMMLTMRSISFGEMGRVRDCSRSRFITWVVN